MQRSSRKRLCRTKHGWLKTLGGRDQFGDPLDPASRMSTVCGGYFPDSLLSAGYSWSRQLPPALSVVQSTSHVLPTLKSICQKAICFRLKEIDLIHLESASWSCWQGVWHHVLRNRLDSLHCFMIFSTQFSSFAGFTPHIGSLSALVDLLLPRDTAIEMLRVPRAKCHRLENVYCNIDLAKLGTYMLQFQGLNAPLLLFDVSSILFKRDQLFSLLHMPRIFGIDFSHQTSIDDGFLHSLGSAMVLDGAFKDLVVIVLQDCPKVSKNGLVALLEMLSTCHVSLSLIQTNLSVQAQPERKYIRNTKWMTLDMSDRELQLVLTLPLGLKINTLFRLLSSSESISTEPHCCPQFQNETVLDIYIDNNIGTNQSQDGNDSWRARMQGHFRTQGDSILYVANNKRMVNLSNANAKDSLSSQQKRPKRIKVSASAFFKP